MGRSGLYSKRKHSKKKGLKVSSEARRKKRSRRTKSKKLRHHDDSFSSYSSDESTSSSLVSSSSSEDEYRSRKSRSRARQEVKGGKKRTRRSSSEESLRDSLPIKKRKESKKKKKNNKKNKNKKNKKVKRDAYSSSTSDSASCSTCSIDVDSGSDKEAALKLQRGRKRHWKNRSRPRNSFSPNKFSDSYDDDSIEKVVVENNSRRLKSVITVGIQPDEEERNDMNKDELKEEIVYDHDDYPSSKSNDSNDGENKKELLDYVDSKEKDGNNACVNTGLEADNLELILRQKALENLSKFRGGLQRKPIVPDDKDKSNQSSVNQFPTASVGLGQTQSKVPASEQDGVVQRSRFTWRREPSVATGKEEKGAPAPKLQGGNLSSTGSVVNNNAQKSTINTQKSTSYTQKPTNDLQKPTSDFQKSTLDAQKSTNDAQKSTSVVGTPSVEGSSKEQQNETKDNSQFEQKTMSVMRGGEMVQVSYKVYIPKKAPALARRQLKR